MIRSESMGSIIDTQLKDRAYNRTSENMGLPPHMRQIRNKALDNLERKLKLMGERVVARNGFSLVTPHPQGEQRLYRINTDGSRDTSLDNIVVDSLIMSKYFLFYVGMTEGDCTDKWGLYTESTDINYIADDYIWNTHQTVPNDDTPLAAFKSDKKPKVINKFGEIYTFDVLMGAHNPNFIIQPISTKDSNFIRETSGYTLKFRFLGDSKEDGSFVIFNILVAAFDIDGRLIVDFIEKFGLQACTTVDAQDSFMNKNIDKMNKILPNIKMDVNNKLHDKLADIIKINMEKPILGNFREFLNN